MAEDQNQPPPAPQSEHEISDYYEGVRKLEMEGYEAGIKKARNALFVTAALVFVSEMLIAGMSGIPLSPLLIGIVVIEAGIFVALGFWTKTKPFTAIVTGLVIFILMWVATIAFNDGKAAYSGILVRIVVISYLYRALKPAREWEQLKKQG